MYNMKDLYICILNSDVKNAKNIKINYFNFCTFEKMHLSRFCSKLFNYHSLNH